MKYLIDTITFNTYRDIKMGIYTDQKRPPKQVNIDKLEKFIDNNKENVLIHSATLFELYIKCIKNTKGQQSYKLNNEISLKQFGRDYQFIHKNGFKILNEKPYYFDQDIISNFFNKGEKFTPESYIEEKIKMEVNGIIRYILFIDLIFSYELFDIYGDYVNDEIILLTMEFKVQFLEDHLKRIMNSYYYSDENKEASTKRIDELLGYILNESEKLIKDKFYLCIDEEFIINTLINIWTQKDISKVSGVDKVHDSFGGYSAVELIEKINHKVRKIKKLNPSIFSHVEEYYFKNLLKKSIIDKYKITKNDFSDFLIISAGDFNNLNIIDDEIVVITYDKRLKTFLKENKFYYNDELYNLIYID